MNDESGNEDGAQNIDSMDDAIFQHDEDGNIANNNTNQQDSEDEGNEWCHGPNTLAEGEQS